MNLPFDTVIVKEGGTEQRLDAESFLAMSLHRRVRLILERRVSLFLGAQPVSLSQALKGMPTSQSSKPPRKP